MENVLPPTARSESLAKLGESLCKAQGSMKTVPKKKENPFFRSSYADLAAVWDAIRKPLTDNGLSVVQTTAELPGNKWVLTSILLHVSGEFISFDYPLYSMKQDSQGMGSAMTYARRYSIMALVGAVAEDEDDDGNAASGKFPSIKDDKNKTQNARAGTKTAVDKPPTSVNDRRISPAEQVKLFSIAKTNNIPDEHLSNYIQDKYGVNTTNQLTYGQMQEIIIYLNEAVK